MLLLIVFGALAISLTSLLAFGSGLAFIPFFKWIWHVFSPQIPSLCDDNFYLSFVTANATPGIFSVKMTVFTAWFFNDSKFWVLFIILLFYTFFITPAMYLMFLSMKYLKKVPHYKRILRNLLPVTTGIIIATIASLFISNLIPWIVFNRHESYFSILAFNSKETAISARNFFSQWRLYVLLAWAPLSVLLAILLIHKYKVSILKSILFFLVLCFLLFWPF